MHIRYIFLLCLFVALPSRADYMPFGLSMGYPASKLQGCTTLPPDDRIKFSRCSTKEVPIKDDRFTEFNIGYTEKTGACNISAKANFDTTHDASTLKQAYMSIVGELTQALGQPKFTNGDLNSKYWINPKDHLAVVRSPVPVAGMIWQKNNTGENSGTISMASLDVTALDVDKAKLFLWVSFDNHWRCSRPEISPSAKVLKFNTTDLGFEQLGQGTVKLTQTEIAPEIYWMETLDIRPSPQVGGGALQFYFLVRSCAAWKASKLLGHIYSFVPSKRFSGELLAFIPPSVSPAEIEAKTGGKLKEGAQPELNRLRQLCEELPAQLKAVQSNPELQGVPANGHH